MGVDGIELKNSFQQEPRTIPLMGVAYESVISQTKRVTPSPRYQNNKFINRNLNLISILLHHFKKKQQYNSIRNCLLIGLIPIFAKRTREQATQNFLGEFWSSWEMSCRHQNIRLFSCHSVLHAIILSTHLMTPKPEGNETFWFN